MACHFKWGIFVFSQVPGTGTCTRAHAKSVLFCVKICSACHGRSWNVHSLSLRACLRVPVQPRLAASLSPSSGRQGEIAGRSGGLVAAGDDHLRALARCLLQDHPARAQVPARGGQRRSDRQRVRRPPRSGRPCRRTSPLATGARPHHSTPAGRGR